MASFDLPTGLGTTGESIGFIYPVKRVSLSSTTLSAFELDASISEAHEYESEITEHPVEGGANVADHIRNKPHTLKIEGVVTNTPILQAQDVERLGGFAKGRTGRAEDAFQALMNLRDRRELVTVATRLKTYESMAIQSISVPRNAKTGDALRFSITLRHVRIVESRFVSYAKEPRGQKKAGLGNKPKNSADEATKERTQSLALKAKNAGVKGWRRFFGGEG